MDSNFRFLVARRSNRHARLSRKPERICWEPKVRIHLLPAERVTREPDLLDQIRKFVKCSGAIMLAEFSNLPAKAKGRREMLEVADAYLKLEARLCPCERRLGHAGNRSLRLSTRAIGIAGLARVGGDASSASEVCLSNDLGASRSGARIKASGYAPSNCRT